MSATPLPLYRAFATLPGGLKQLAVLLFLVNVSTFSSIPLLSVYIVNDLKFSATEAGLVIGAC